MDVAGPVTNRLADDQADQAHDGGVPALLVAAGGQLRLGALRRVLVDAGHRLGQLVRVRVDERVDEALDPAQRSQDGGDLGVEAEPQQVQRLQVQGVGDDHLEPPVLVAHRQHHVLADQVGGDEVQLALIDHLVQVDELEPELGGQGLGHVLLAAKLQLDQSLADPLAVLGGVLQGVRQGVGVDQAPTEQDVADFLALSGHWFPPVTERIPGGEAQTTGAVRRPPVARTSSAHSPAPRPGQASLGFYRAEPCTSIEQRTPGPPGERG